MSVRVIKRRPRIYMPHWDVRLAMMFNKHNYVCIGIQSQPHDVACFVDGPPVNPIFYGERKLAFMKCDVTRDREDQHSFRQLKRAIPKIGIGRGAHFLNIMNGGGAWQRVDKHIGIHKSTDLMTNETVMLSSRHEQLMLPADGSDMVAVTDVGRTFEGDDIALSRDRIDDAIDVEACYYSYTNSLCFQPPVQDGHKPTEEYFFKCLHEFLTDTLPSSITFEP